MLYSKDPKTGETLSDENIRHNVRFRAHSRWTIIDLFYGAAAHVPDRGYVLYVYYGLMGTIN